MPWTLRLAPIALACALVPALASVAVAAPARPVSVIGGKNASLGEWPDVAAILYPDDPSDPTLDVTLCTGTLIAPTVVLTAGHCYDPNNPPLPDNVLIGAATLARPEQGEVIAIKQGFVYPDAETSFDLAVLVLARPSTRRPRAVVDGWAIPEVTNGAKVSIVGYGATDAEAMILIDELQEATTTITDADCSMSSGCNAAAQPAGELGAGGMGIDTCPGDSGGPLYLMTSRGPVLAGVTSRGYDDSPLPCSAGGIYVRPDKVLDWIETTAGVPVSRASELSEGGCCDAGGSSGGAIPLAIGVVALARRRRRARS
jgi:endonuclease G